ncbi:MULTISPECIES: hypothetical protein [Sphingobacterium]
MMPKKETLTQVRQKFILPSQGELQMDGIRWVKLMCYKENNV